MTMNRSIAIGLVGLSVVAGAAVGVVVQRSSDTPAAASPRSSASSGAIDGAGSTTTGPVEVTDAVLATSRTGGATFVATLTGPSGAFVDDVTAEIDGAPLPVAIGYDADTIEAAELGTEPLRLGAESTTEGTTRTGTTVWVVHDVEVGQSVRVSVVVDGETGASLDVPVVDGADVDDVTLFEGPAPRFTDTVLALYPGEDRATLGYEVVSRNSRPERVEIERVVGVDEEGGKLPLEHQTATGGGSGIFADTTPQTIRPVAPTGPGEGGDYDYVDGKGLEVGDTVTMRFPFASGLVEVPFEVVAG